LPTEKYPKERHRRLKPPTKTWLRCINPNGEEQHEKNTATYLLQKSTIPQQRI
jgi:hypothetical protein